MKFRFSLREQAISAIRLSPIRFVMHFSLTTWKKSLFKYSLLRKLFIYDFHNIRMEMLFFPLSDSILHSKSLDGISTLHHVCSITMLWSCLYENERSQTMLSFLFTMVTVLDDLLSFATPWWHVALCMMMLIHHSSNSVDEKNSLHCPLVFQLHFPWTFRCKTIGALVFSLVTFI